MMGLAGHRDLPRGIMYFIKFHKQRGPTPAELCVSLQVYQGTVDVSMILFGGKAPANFGNVYNATHTTCGDFPFIA